MYLDEIQVKKTNSQRYETVCGWLMSCLPVLGFIIFGLIPMIVAIYLAFCQTTDFSLGSAYFVGFENFEYVLGDYKFWEAGFNTLFFTLSLPICLILSLCVAFLLTKKIKGKKVFRTIFFIPYVCSVVAVAVMWKEIFNPVYGTVNNMLGLHYDKWNWLGSVKLFRILVILISVWGGCGYSIILYSAALTNINPTLYEAAKMDGANSFQCFTNITLPGVSPTTFYLFITGLIGSLQSFATLHVLNASGEPDGAGITIGFYLYNQIFQSDNMGLASASALILTFFILIITVIQFAISRKWVNYD